MVVLVDGYPSAGNFGRRRILEVRWISVCLAGRMVVSAGRGSPYGKPPMVVARHLEGALAYSCQGQIGRKEDDMMGIGLHELLLLAILGLISVGLVTGIVILVLFLANRKS